MKFEIPKEWIRKMAALEDGCEVGAGTVLNWDNHNYVLKTNGAFWLKDGHGYTHDISEAWLLSESEAEKYVNPDHGTKKVCLDDKIQHIRNELHLAEGRYNRLMNLIFMYDSSSPEEK